MKVGPRGQGRSGGGGQREGAPLPDLLERHRSEIDADETDRLEDPPGVESREDLAEAEIEAGDDSGAEEVEASGAGPQCGVARQPVVGGLTEHVADQRLEVSTLPDLAEVGGPRPRRGPVAEGDPDGSGQPAGLDA